jgi:hypothetical protein
VARSDAEGAGAGADGDPAASSPGSNSVISVTNGRSETALLRVISHKIRSTWSTKLVIIVQRVRRR